jgi:hypothetical protein
MSKDNANTGITEERIREITQEEIKKYMSNREQARLNYWINTFQTEFGMAREEVLNKFRSKGVIRS